MKKAFLIVSALFFFSVVYCHADDSTSSIGQDRNNPVFNNPASGISEPSFEPMSHRNDFQQLPEITRHDHPVDILSSDSALSSSTRSQTSSTSLYPLNKSMNAFNSNEERRESGKELLMEPKSTFEESGPISSLSVTPSPFGNPK